MLVLQFFQSVVNGATNMVVFLEVIVSAMRKGFGGDALLGKLTDDRVLPVEQVKDCNDTS